MTQPFKICPQCREPLTLNAASCVKCGLPQDTAAPPIVPPLPPGPRDFAAMPSPGQPSSQPIRKGLSDRIKMLLLSVSLVIMMVVTFIIYSYVDDAGKNTIFKGMYDGYLSHEEKYDRSYFMLGAETRKAFALVAVGQSPAETVAKLGTPMFADPPEDPYSHQIYAYRDGWLDVYYKDSHVLWIFAFGPYVHPTAYPPAQSELARLYGTPIGTDWKQLIDTKPSPQP
ncbi:MAG: hypothetical protein JWL77_2794 [Chthonomonadaceae bacterium]|nr:hypothetical protein [Chthonomonadaceae bacterium]